jgi:hypothetical protein
VQHILSPTSTFALLVLAFVLDYSAPGSHSLRDRVAFLMATCAIHEGFAGGPLQRWTTGQLTNLITWLKAKGDGSYIAGAATQDVVGVVVILVALWAVFCCLPMKLSTKLGVFGPLAKLSFPATNPTGRLNVKLWVAAVFLGVMIDVPGGGVAGLLRGVLAFLTSVFGMLPNFVFGVV